MMKCISLFAINLICIYFLNGQSFDPTQFNHLAPRNIGPAGMSGRITAIDVDTKNNIIYGGAASGGVWKSVNGGVSWDPIFDDQPVQSIGSIAVHDANPSIIWVGTGEGNPRNSHNSGAGIYQSVDGGNHWMYKGLKETKLIHRVIVKKDDANTIFAGAMGSAWGDSEHRGVYKSVDGGDTWKKVLYVDQRTGVAELIVDPNNPNKLFAAMWDFRRTPWDFTSGGQGSGLYVSYDAGESWTKLTEEEGLPEGDLGRIGMTISAANSNVVYALVEAEENALYKSFDGGQNWVEHSTHENIGNRPFYYYELHADPNNENIVYSLWTYVSKSTDGGKTFEIIADYGNDVHPDHHAFWIDSDDSNYLIDGNDGGMNISHDAGASWKFIPNLPVGQFYHVSVDDDFPYNVYGGMQDNGSWAGPGFVLKNGGITNYDWQEVMFGDGFDVVPLPSDNRYGYAMSQGGNIGRYDRLTGRTEFIRPVHPEGEDLRYNWNAALAQDPFENCSLYYGSQYVHYSRDCGLSWDIISPDLTTNDTMKQKQLYSGGLTYDATGAENNTTILCIAPSPVNKSVIWVGTDDGNLQVTTDGGGSWNNVIKNIPSAPKHAWIPQIEVSSYDQAEAFVVINNYRQNDWSAHLYHTTDYGKTWRRLVDDRDVGGFVNAITQDPVEPNLLFLGTDAGLYISLDKGKDWSLWNEGFPQVQIRDMKIQEAMNDLVIGTFGRSFWIMDDIRPLRELVKAAGIVDKEFHLFDGPEGYLTTNRSYDGVRFGAQGSFSGENKSGGAVFSLWHNPTDKTDDKLKEKSNKPEDTKDDGDIEEDNNGAKKRKKNMLYITIISEDGDTVRDYSRKLTEKGLNRVSWNMRQDGVRSASRAEIEEDADLPSGSEVMPGTYKAVMVYGEHKDSTHVHVKLDPRLQITDAEIRVKRESVKQFDELVDLSAKSYNLLNEARKAILVVEGMMVNLPDSTEKHLKKLNEEHQDKIKELEQRFSNTEKVKGIQRDPSKLNSMLWGVRRYLTSSWGEPGENARNAVRIYTEKSKEAIRAINDYIDGDWRDYEAEVSEIRFNPFKELKTLKID